MAASAAEGSQSTKSAVQMIKDKHGVDLVMLQNHKGSSVQVSLHGGQVLSWRNETGEDLLFSSSKAIVFKPPAAATARGGIPICFPQFESRGFDHLEHNGFARNKIWEIDKDPPPLRRETRDDGLVFVDLLLKPCEDDMKIWPHSYEFRLRVSLTCEGGLTLVSRVRNIGHKPFGFSVAYNTYFSVSDISEVRIEGLETLNYLDNLNRRERCMDQGDALTFENEVDRVYIGSPRVIGVFDHGKKRTFVIRKKGLPDVAVWNPWEKKARTITDMADEEYKQMVCVAAAAINEPIRLKPGEEWTGRLELTAVPSI